MLIHDATDEELQEFDPISRISVLHHVIDFGSDYIVRTVMNRIPYRNACLGRPSAFESTVRSNMYDRMELLLEYLDVDTEEIQGHIKRCLGVAIDRGHGRIARRLIELLKDDRSITAAIYHGIMDIEDTTKDAFFVWEADGDTLPLYNLSSGRIPKPMNTEMLELIIEYGDKESCDKLLFPMCVNFTGCQVRMLLEELKSYHWEVPIGEREFRFRDEDTDYETSLGVLGVAIRASNYDALLELLASLKQDEIDRFDTCTGYTALHVSVLCGNVEMTKMIKDLMSDTIVTRPAMRKDGKTAFEYAQLLSEHTDYAKMKKGTLVKLLTPHVKSAVDE